MICKDEKWVNICELDEDNDLRFTKEYLDIMKDVSSKARSFAAKISTHFGVENLQTLLDYFGPEDEEMDRFSGIDGEKMDVREDLCDLMDYNDLAGSGLGGEWYRDCIRSKLISIRIPERLIKEYVKIAKNNNK